MDLSVVPYEEPRGRGERSPESGGYGGSGGGKYKECMRNHAAAIGGQAYDGCGEFMPGGVKGTLEALKCAACGCHRNFHRRDGGSGAGACDLYRPIHLKKPIPPTPGFMPFFAPPIPLPLPYNAIPPPPASAAPIHLGGDRSRAGSETPPRRGEEDDDATAAHDFRSGSGGRKRFRTKFTAEQKEKMQAFAEKLGWRIQKHDDVALDQFCLEIGVKRHVLKVWMHNNKNHHLSSAASSATTAANPAAVSGAAASPAPIQV
ncbi:zinc-finger homeodomain protein 2-like [Typha latifolia]|uniref:zinc-finger homeodomain protein 2-like n=1 Tax=Typha latifolia TaxID=4733 RepID=UPI003C2BB29A